MSSTAVDTTVAATRSPRRGRGSGRRHAGTPVTRCVRHVSPPGRSTGPSTVRRRGAGSGAATPREVGHRGAVDYGSHAMSEPSATPEQPVPDAGTAARRVRRGPRAQRGAAPARRRRPDARPGLRRPARGRPRARAEPRPHRRDRRRDPPRRTRGCGSSRTPPAAPRPASTPRSPTRPTTSIVRVDGHALVPRDYVADRGRGAAAHRCRQRRRDHGGRGRDAVRAGRRPRHDLEARGRRRVVPRRRRGGPGTDRLPRGLPPLRARARRRLRRVDGPGAGLGDEPPHHRDRRSRVVHPADARHLPPATDRARAGQAVLRVRPLAPRGRPPPPRHPERALPRRPGRGARHRRRHRCSG